MSEDGVLLKEIADLLRRRVEIAERAFVHQQEQDRQREARSAEAATRLEERLSQVTTPQIEAFDPDRFEKHLEEIKQRLDDRAEREQTEQQRFYERFVESLERQNAILEKIAARLEGR
jgi:Cdc6-like AAA superfamily ATPase